MIRKYVTLLLLTVVIFVGCTRNDKFTVAGQLANGDKKTIYFEKNGLVTDSLIDSLVLKSQGNFEFKARKVDYPEFYRLRVDNQQLILVVDSSETIHVKGDVKNLIDAGIEGSKQSVEVQQLRKSLLSLQNQLIRISAKNSGEENTHLRDSLIANIERHKKIVRNLILTNQLSMSAYYGLFQQLGGEYIFSPYRLDDLPFYQAVATGFDAYMPEYERSENLYQIVIAALNEKRKAKKISEMDFLDEVKETGFIDLELKDKNGYPKKISDLLGNIILVDFTTYESERKTDHVFDLRSLYNAYSQKGLKIYQVGIGKSKQIWNQSVATLPWTCVWDEVGQGAQNYNVQQLPTLFLISREGSILGRYASVNEVRKSIANQF